MDRDPHTDTLRRRTFVKRALASGPDIPPSIPLAIPSNLLYDHQTNTITKPSPKLTTNTTSIKSSVNNRPRPPVCLIPRALELLQGIEKPVAVLSICGPYRSGKSYILSRILGVSNAFGVGHTMKQCTYGVWLATTVLECEDYVVVFLDTEGTDHAGATEADLKCNFSLLVFTVLISSTLIYNSMHVPRRSDLEAMSFFAQLSSMVRSTRKQNVEFDSQQQFPKFRWLFRDVMLPPVNDSGDEIPITDFVRTQILSDKSSSSPHVQSVIDALLQLFPSFECHILPILATKRDVLKSITKNESKLSSEFNDDVALLSQNILNDIEPKRSVTSGHQQCKNGSLLSTLIEECLESLNTTDVIPDLRFGWQAAMESHLEASLNRLVGEYTQQLEETLQSRGVLEESVPANFESLTISPTESCRSDSESEPEILVLKRDVSLSPQQSASAQSTSQRTYNNAKISQIHVTPNRTLVGIHQSILDSKRNDFRREINRYIEVVSEERKSELLLRLEKRIVIYEMTSDGNFSGRIVGGILLKYIQENYVKSKERCCQTFDHVIEPLKQNLTRAIDTVQDEYYSMAVGPAKDDIFALKMSEFTELASRLAPGPPSNLRIVGQATDKLKIRWKRPKLHPRAVKGYEVQVMERVKQQRRGEWRTIISSTVNRATIVTDLTKSTTYLFRVRGRNTNQMGEWSEEIEGTTRMGEAGRCGASAVGFVSGSIAAPFMLTAKTFKEGWQICKECETCSERVQASFGMVVGGLMAPVIMLSGSLLMTSTGMECAERVYENAGVTEEDDFDESRSDVVSIVPCVESNVPTSNFNSDSNTIPNSNLPGHQNFKSGMPASHSSSDSNSIPDSNPTGYQNFLSSVPIPATIHNESPQPQQPLKSTTILEIEDTQTSQDVVGKGESTRHYHLNVDCESSPSDDIDACAEAYANPTDTSRGLCVAVTGTDGEPSQLCGRQLSNTNSNQSFETSTTSVVVHAFPFTD